MTALLTYPATDSLRNGQTPDSQPENLTGAGHDSLGDSAPIALSTAAGRPSTASGNAAAADRQAPLRTDSAATLHGSPITRPRAERQAPVAETIAAQHDGTTGARPTGAPIPARALPDNAARSATNTLAGMPADPATDSATGITTDSPSDSAADTLPLSVTSRDTTWLTFFPGLELPETAHWWRDASAAEVFGDASTLAPTQAPPPAQGQSLTENPVFQGFVLLLAATYAILLYRNLGDIQHLLTRISHDRASGKRLTEDPGGSGFSRFLNIATTIGMLFMGVMAVKYGDMLMPGTLTDVLSEGAVLALSLLTTLACMAVALFQVTTVRLAGAVTLSQPFISQLVLLKRTYFSLAVIVTSPALLLFALCPRGTGEVWFYVIAVELFVTAILYLKETFALFISKKISLLHWILYLCTVEIFPISLLWLLVAR